MELDIISRITELNFKLQEITDELVELQNLVIGINALKLVNLEENKNKFKYTPEEYKLVEDSVLNLCNKHEIRLPEYIEWNNIDIK